ncbi:MAG: M14 family metallopeptidase, partial [Acidobacteriota bacterium]
MRNRTLVLSLSVVMLLGALPARAQRKITSPQEQFGHDVGADYVLINYTRLVEYWKKLAQESDRMRLVEFGKTAEGRTMYMAILTSPENHKKLDRYREISRRLAMAEGLTDEEARKLAAEGRAVVWTDGGLHATEVVNGQQEIELVYQMVSRNDPETLRFLDDVIILTSVSNPDGLELVADWYMREPDPKKRRSGDIPRLYHKYVGHDNNRDFYMVNMPETEAVCRVLYQEWFPQIMYNKHQTGPVGTVLFAPPFTPLYNYYLDPLITVELDLVGAAIHTRFVAENKPGAVMREMFSTWWNGGARTTPYFHNQIGLLTEVNGNPTPQEIPFVPERILPNSNNPYPVQPQKTFHFRTAIEYIITVDRAIFDVASKYRQDFLYNMYLMGKRSIERGNRDNWTFLPRQLEAVKQQIEKDRSSEPAEATPRGGYFRRGVPEKYYQMLRVPDRRDARGYIIPSDQPDFLTATKFVNSLIKNGIAVHRAAQSFQAAGKSYPAGSYVVKSAQAFRPHILDMFEPQDHPDDIPYPGGPPTPPYDSAGYTLAFQTGVQFDRILDNFDGPFEKIQGLARPPAGKVAGSGTPGFLFSTQVNDSFLAANRLLAAGEKVWRLKGSLQANGKTYPAGTFYVPASASVSARLEALAKEKGLLFEGINTKPGGELVELRQMRIGLWDRYGGSMPSGWTRWLLEQFEFRFEVVYPPALDAGGLAQKFDILIFEDGAVPMRDQAREFPEPQSIPAEYRSRLGDVTVGKTIPQLRQFLNDGGIVIGIGSSTNLAYHLGLPVTNALVEAGTGRPLPRETYYMPGSVHRVH